MKIASIDKHPVLRFGLSVFLKNYFRDTTILEAESMISYQKMYQNDTPDLVIIGMVEEAEGIDMCILSEMMLSHPKAAFIIYAGKPQYKVAISCLFSGVRGYALKSGNLDELTQCIETVLQGRRYLSHEVTDIFVNECFELFDHNNDKYQVLEKKNELGKFLSREFTMPN